jgi:hypothetical protein
MKYIIPAWMMVHQLRHLGGSMSLALPSDRAGFAAVVGLAGESPVERDEHRHCIRAAQTSPPPPKKTSRPAGCRLAIEMWYPVSEWPPEPVLDAFSKLGVTSRKLDFRWATLLVMMTDGSADGGVCQPSGLTELRQLMGSRPTPSSSPVCSRLNPPPNHLPT